MSDSFYGKIIQIMPAPAGMFAVYAGDDVEPEYRLPIVAIGLSENGYVVPLEIDGIGTIGEVSSIARIECPGL